MSELATILVCLATAVITYLGFRDPELHERLLFRPERILAGKEWHRIFSSALLHADWAHLGFNLFSLYSFGAALETFWGATVFLSIYVGSIAGGSLLSLFLNRHRDYAALGASGGVCGVIFATIFLVPGTGVGMFMVPISIPGPIYAVLYLIGTFVALRRGVGNIGHDAHFGGALGGLLIALALAPRLCLASPMLFGGALVLSAGCLFVLARDPFGISCTITSFGRRQEKANVRYQRYDENRERRSREAEIDRVLDKISASGIESLTARERALLEVASERVRRE